VGRQKGLHFTECLHFQPLFMEKNFRVENFALLGHYAASSGKILADQS